MKLFFKNARRTDQISTKPIQYFGVRKMILMSFLTVISVSTKAQVFPPDFQCVVNDTIVWELPNNNCGPFNAYEIYFSASPTGPFQLLTTITNQNQTAFYHNNPAGETWYYYMQSDYDCPGEPILTSDTLSNLAPEIARISSVSVNGNNVEINWQPSPSPEVSHYVIYRTTPQGVLPIDTVTALFTDYLDTGANPKLKSESYYVIATDFCGNTSVFDLPHFTIHIEDAVDPCDRTITLNWNLYKNWPNGIEFQELWYSVNGSTSSLLETLSNTDSSYIFKNTNDGDDYCFFVKATESNTGEVSYSNEHCLNLDIVEPVRELFIKNVSVNASNQVELSWLWNNDAEVKTVNFEGKYEGEDLTNVESFSPTYPLSIENSRTLNEFDPTQNKINFQMITIDDCEDEFTSENDGSTIFLAGIPNENLTNTITWTDFDMEEGTVSSYDIFRIVGSNETFLETVNAATTNYTDEVDVENEAEANICYYVVADITMELPGGQTEWVKSRSNTICVEQHAQIISPNAFAPEGINKEFKPVIVFGETATYQMVIYDRWGQKIFETQNKDEGWTGQNGLSMYPSGVYAYLIKIQQSSGRVVEDKGTVILLR